MIKIIEIQKAIAELLRKHFTNNDVGIYFDNVADSRGKSFFYVEIICSNNYVDDSWVDKKLFIDICYVPFKGDYNRVKRAELYNISNQLENALHGGLEVNNRHLRIFNSGTQIVDDILHFNFNIEYADGEQEQSTNELMRELFVKLKK